MVCDYTRETLGRYGAEGWGGRRGGRKERTGGGGWKGYEGAAGSAALIKLAEDNEPVCRLACLAV